MGPVVLHHGFFGFGELTLGALKLSYFRGVAKALESTGRPVLKTWVHPTSSVASRAAELKRQIDDFVSQLGPDAPKLTLVAHSMGGLDARYVISKLGLSDRVASLVTIATPHRGSPYADWCLRNTAMRTCGLPLLDWLRIDVTGARDLTLEACTRFNEQVPDAPDVRYYSVAAVCPPSHVPLICRHPYGVVAELQGDNDILVSRTSAAWGTILPNWPVHHFHAVNHLFPEDRLRRAKHVVNQYIDAVHHAQSMT